MGDGGAGLALMFPRTGLVIGFPEASSGTPVLGSNLQSLAGSLDFLPLAKSIASSVTQDFRAIFTQSGNTVLLVYIDHHDDAYLWASNRLQGFDTASAKLENASIYVSEQTMFVAMYMPPLIYDVHQNINRQLIQSLLYL